MAVQRRNIAESLSRAEQAFLTAPERPFPHEHSVGLARSSTPSPTRKEPARLIARQANMPDSGSRPAVQSSRRPEPLRSITLRLRASTAESLRRASITRALNYTEPFTQQAIVEAAVREWLAGHGIDSHTPGSDTGPQGS